MCVRGNPILFSYNIMNTVLKLVVGLIVLLVIAIGAYYLYGDSASSLGGATAKDMKEIGVPAATGSFDDFEAALQAELDASAAAIKAFDSDIDASVDTVVNSGKNIYDPNNI